MEKVILGIAAAVLGSGCEIFCGCQPNCIEKTFEIAVVDADTGVGIPGAKLTQTSADGTSASYFTACSPAAEGCIAGFGAGSFDLRVEAEGYAASNFTLEIGRDICGRAVEQRRVVRLTKLGSSTKSLIEEEAATFDSCG